MRTSSTGAVHGVPRKCHTQRSRSSSRGRRPADFTPVFNCSGPVVGGFSCGPAPIHVAGDPIYLSFYGTGIRGANAGNVIASLSGVHLPVEYAGPQGTPGVDQINVRVLPEAVLDRLVS